VCERCYLLYQQAKDLLKLEVEFAAKMGLPVTEDSLIEVLGDRSRLLVESKSRSLYELRQDRVPRKIEIGRGFEIEVSNDVPLRTLSQQTNMIRYRLLIFFQTIREITSFEPYPYYLEYQLFGQKMRYRLDSASEDKDKEVSINRFRMFYLFAPSARTLSDYFQAVRSLHLQITTEETKAKREVFATLDLDLTDFEEVHMRELYKMFNLKNGKWGWGLSVSIGLVPGGEWDTSNMNLRYDRGIFLPPNDYFVC
jgi:hypothetical protein